MLKVSLAVLGLSVSPRLGWAGTIYSNNFSQNAADFTGGTITTAPSGEQFLAFGGAGGSATLNLSGIEPHSSLSLSFSLYVVGSMDGDGQNGGGGDYFTVNYAGSSSATLFNYTFANYGGGNTQNYPVPGSAPGTGAASINALGYSGFPDSGNGIQDSEYAITLTPIIDSDGNVSFTFFDNSNEGMSNEFYGIDNVVVTDVPSGVTVPEPGGLAMLVVGLGMAGYVRRRAAVVAA
jgi:hypothetical protein